MNLFAFLPMIGGPEIAVIVVLGILLFGKKLPTYMKSLGEGIWEFKNGIGKVMEDIDDE